MSKEEMREIIEAIKQMSVMDVMELVKTLEEEFGVKAASVAPVTVAPADMTVPDTNAPTPVDEEQSEFKVVLQEVGAKKIEVIKAARKVVPTLALLEAKQLVESAPATLKEGVSREEADQIKEILESAGATVKIE